jgi:hypothetical protein
VRTLALCAAATGLSAAIWGCGADDGLGERYPVRGTVSYNGKPLQKGRINFLSVSSTGRSAGGEILDGVYSLTTQDPGDGALPGKYRVSIVAKEPDFSDVEAKSQKLGGTLPSKKDLGRAFQKAKRLIPAKYEVAETSQLEAEVEPQSNTIDFALADDSMTDPKPDQARHSSRPRGHK